MGLIISAPLAAHEPVKGQNRGLRVDAGMYHAELLDDGSTRTVLFLSNADAKPFPAAVFKATAIFIVDGKSQRIEFAPADPSRLVGTASSPIM